MMEQGEPYKGDRVELEVIENGYLVHYRGTVQEETAAYHTIEEALAKIVMKTHATNVGNCPQVSVEYVEGYLK